MSAADHKYGKVNRGKTSSVEVEDQEVKPPIRRNLDDGGYNEFIILMTQF